MCECVSVWVYECVKGEAKTRHKLGVDQLDAVPRRRYREGARLGYVSVRVCQCVSV